MKAREPLFDTMADASIPVAFVPEAEHGLPGRLGFAPAPGRLSATTGCPHIADSGWPITRAMISSPPPGAAGTMIRTGLVG